MIYMNLLNYWNTQPINFFLAFPQAPIFLNIFIVPLKVPEILQNQISLPINTISCHYKNHFKMSMALNKQGENVQFTLTRIYHKMMNTLQN